MVNPRFTKAAIRFAKAGGGDRGTIGGAPRDSSISGRGACARAVHPSRPREGKIRKAGRGVARQGRVNAFDQVGTPRGIRRRSGQASRAAESRRDIGPVDAGLFCCRRREPCHLDRRRSQPQPRDGSRSAQRARLSGRDHRRSGYPVLRPRCHRAAPAAGGVGLAPGLRPRPAFRLGCPCGLARLDAGCRFALATLPVLGTWPLPTGFGGVIGDLLLNIPAFFIGGTPSGFSAAVLCVVFTVIAVFLGVPRLWLSRARQGTPRRDRRRYR